MSVLELDPIFAQVEDLTGQDIVDAARVYRGLRYSNNTFVTQTARGVTGFCDCAGLFLLTAIDLGLLPQEFDPNLPPALTGMSRESALKAILRANFTSVETARGGLEIGDLLIVKWPAQSGDEFGRHMAIWTGAGLIHAINDVSGTGNVREEPLEAHMESLIWRAYRMNLVARAGGDLNGA